MSLSGQQIVDEAREWIGTPFHHQQAVKGVGCDCYGLVRGVAKALGLVPGHVPVTDYARIPDGRMLRYLAIELVRVHKLATQPGDVVAFAWGRQVQHMGIFTERGTVIHGHGTDRHGGVVETSLAGRHKERLRAVFRFPELV